ncbi:MAG: tryptophan 7-halogenase [Pseudomonadota bacterium]
MSFDVLIIGGGPAGVAAALRLAKMEHAVAVVAKPRRGAAVEGLSERAYEVLRTLGCERAGASLGREVVRQSHWNGATSEHNRETLVDRRAFDRALLEDAEAQGLAVIYAKTARPCARNGGWEIVGTSGDNAPFAVSGKLLIEARGRRAPGAGRRARRGPGTTALARVYGGVPAQPRTAIAAFRDGWAWYASQGDGTGLLQVFVDHEQGQLPKRGALAGHFAGLAGQVTEAGEWLGVGQAKGAVTVRAAGPVHWPDPVGPNSIRIGDAAAAVDPLSGHGIFEALGSALAGAVVVNTLLRRPDQRALAEAFYQERVAQGFERNCRTGRAFYALEQRWPEAPFWRARATWPDQAPVHAPPFESAPSIERRPVVEDDLVVARPVVVTPDHPRGVYQVADVPLVALLEQIESATSDGSLAERLKVTRTQLETALAWLRYRRMIGAG